MKSEHLHERTRIAVVSTDTQRNSPEDVAKVRAALEAKGYEIVEEDQATHIVGDDELADFILAARANARQKQLAAEAGDAPIVRRIKKIGRKADRQKRLREMQARAFKGE